MIAFAVIANAVWRCVYACAAWTDARSHRAREQRSIRGLRVWSRLYDEGCAGVRASLGGLEIVL